MALTQPLLQGNSRSIPIKVVAKANNLDLIEIHVDADKPDTEYLKLNKLGKIPSFVGEDGYELTECIAIAIYGMPGPSINLCCTKFYAVMMRNSIIYSYPCLKTTVENHSHSDSHLHSTHCPAEFPAIAADE